MNVKMMMPMTMTTTTTGIRLLLFLLLIGGGVFLDAASSERIGKLKKRRLKNLPNIFSKGKANLYY